MRIVSPQDDIALQIAGNRIKWRSFIDGQVRLIKIDDRDENGAPLTPDEYRRRVRGFRTRAYQAAERNGMRVVTHWHRKRHLLYVRFIMADEDPGPTLIDLVAVSSKCSTASGQHVRQGGYIEPENDDQGATDE